MPDYRIPDFAAAILVDHTIQREWEDYPYTSYIRYYTYKLVDPYG